ncbi:MAG TPA: radical SAM protein [Polyangiaceae bacterium]|nr:radical SAM protein [Polyangiaceae bacterium]
MRIALLYPPPWKIPAPGEPPDALGDGPPAEYVHGDLDGDFFQTPYGLFALGAQALRAGHSVKVINLSGFIWTQVEHVLQALDADLYGLSCWTANRRGVALVAREIKRLRPHAIVVVGGPHATPLAREMLVHHPEIDCVAVGESEATFLELVDRVQRGERPTAIAGTVYRDRGAVVAAPDRPAIEQLDSLASPHDYFDTHIVMTSRGCAWRCTFCGAEASWGRGYRGQSVPYVLDALERAVARAPVKMIQIKDDTFTTNRKRVIALCRGIRERNLRFLWSCDTRVDVLGDELLREMRLAGCERLSLGVESGSQKILDAIDKKITPDEIIASSDLAKKYGIKLRYYMMLGNRGETRQTFAETLRFLERAKPHQTIFACLSVYPGTRDYEEAVQQGWLDAEFYFERDFQELKTTFDACEEDTAFFREWFRCNKGLREGFREGVDELQAVLERLGDHHAAHLDLGAAYFRVGRLDDAERHVQRALDLEYPAPGLALNYLACIAARRGDASQMRARFAQATARDPQHWVLAHNLGAVERWRASDAADPTTLDLVATHDFQLLERGAQPTLPGPLSRDFAVWYPPLRPPDVPVGSGRGAGPRALPVVRA